VAYALVRCRPSRSGSAAALRQCARTSAPDPNRRAKSQRSGAVSARRAAPRDRRPATAVPWPRPTTLPTEPGPSSRPGWATAHPHRAVWRVPPRCTGADPRTPGPKDSCGVRSGLALGWRRRRHVHRPSGRETGIQPATLRKWERAGLVHPRRDPRTRYRVYDEADVRDAQLTYQLRRGATSWSRSPR